MGNHYLCGGSGELEVYRGFKIFLMVTTMADRGMCLESQIGGGCDVEKSEKQGLGVTSSETQSKTALNSPEKSTVTQKEEIGMTAGGSGGGTHLGGEHSGTTAGGPKVLSKTQKRNRRRKQKREEVETNTDDAPPKGSKDSGSKRKVIELTPSPQMSAAAKRPKEDVQRSFAAVAAVRKLALVKEGFPLTRLAQEEVDIILKDVIRCIDETPDDRPLPMISDSRLVSGALIFTYEGDATEVWIRNTYHGNVTVFEGISLKVLAMSEMPKPVKVAFKTRDIYTKDPIELLKRLNRYNPELKTGDWRVLDHVAEPQSIRWIFEVDLVASEAIKRADYKVYTGLDKGSFKILNDPNVKKMREKEAKAVAADTSSQVSETSSIKEINTRLENVSVQCNSPSMFLDEVEQLLAEDSEDMAISEEDRLVVGLNKPDDASKDSSDQPPSQ